MSVSYTFISNTNENEDILEVFVNQTYPSTFYPNETDTITQSLDVSDGKITGTVVINTTTLTKSKPTGNTNNLIITDDALIQSLNLLAPYAIQLPQITEISINGADYTMKSYLFINGRKFYYLV